MNAEYTRRQLTPIVRVNLSLPVDLYEEARREAHDENSSITQVIRQALKQHFAKPEVAE